MNIHPEATISSGTQVQLKVCEQMERSKKKEKYKFLDVEGVKFV